MGIAIKNILAVLPGADGTPETRVVSVYIADGIIAGIGDEPIGFAADKTIEGAGKLLIPGFVNAHTHAYMTLFRNQTDDLDFDTWLFKRVMPAEDAMTHDDAYWSTMLACTEMIRGGVTSFIDMHMFPRTIVNAALDSGMRAVISRGLSGGASDVEGGSRRMREALDEIDEFARVSDRISFRLAPHAVTTCDEGYLRQIGETVTRLGLGIHTHLSESPSETELTRSLYGCTPPQLYDRCGLLTERTVVAHCCNISADDIELLAERGVSVALNHASNLKLANGFPQIELLMKSGVNLCLGTDSAASNNSLSIMREMGLTSLLHKARLGDPCAVTASEAFGMATINGAKALDFDKTGEIRIGWQADLAIFDTDRPELIPLGDPIAALCYSSQGLTADTVIIDGEVVMDAGVFAAFDAGEVLSEMRVRKARFD